MTNCRLRKVLSHNQIPMTETLINMYINDIFINYININILKKEHTILYGFSSSHVWM